MQQRKERERASRHQLIVSTARKLAEADGWEAVTTRRLADRVEYSQPVLYSHFRGKQEIIGAVALEGFSELADAVRQAVSAPASQRTIFVALARTYLDFAEQHPAVYDAMFSLNAGLPFADPDTPAPLREAFSALLEPLRPGAGRTHPALFTEVCWAALHGLATLTRAGRLPPEHTASRIDLLADRFLVGQ